MVDGVEGNELAGRNSIILRKSTIGLLVAFGLMLSIFSSLDCKFMKVDVGFKADNAVYQRTAFSIGLWSMEDPNTPEKCLTIDASMSLGSITEGDLYYKSLFFNGDIIWGTARIIAILGIAFGFLDFAIVWIHIFSRSYSKYIRYETILYISLLPFLFEAIKIGMFFNVKPCTFQLWEQNTTIANNMEQVIEQFEADQCLMDRSSYVCLGAFSCYSILLINLIAPLWRANYRHQIDGQQHQSRIDLPIDNASGESNIQSRSSNTMEITNCDFDSCFSSQHTRSTAEYSKSTASSCVSSEGTRSTASSGLTSSLLLVAYMTTILEEDDYDSCSISSQNGESSTFLP